MKTIVKSKHSLYRLKKILHQKQSLVCTDRLMHRIYSLFLSLLVKAPVNSGNASLLVDAPVNSGNASLLVDTPVVSDNELLTTSNRIKKFRILDPRVGHNFGSIILFDRSFDFRFCLAIIFSRLKSNPQEFRQWVLTCDSEHLTNGILTQLQKSLPSADDLKKLSELINEINDLPDSEQYFCAVSLYFSK